MFRVQRTKGGDGEEDESADEEEDVAPTDDDEDVLVFSFNCPLFVFIGFCILGFSFSEGRYLLSIFCNNKAIYFYE